MMAPETKSSKATFMRLLLAATLAGAATMSAPALAADLPTSPSAAANPQTTLPSLAADPQTQAPNWSGFYVGAGVEGSFAKGAKSAFGGDVYAGYDHVFDNNVVLGARFSTGFSPWAVPGSRFQGMDFAETSVKMGYEMGRLTPYVMTGVALARPAFSGGGIANMQQFAQRRVRRPWRTPGGWHGRRRFRLCDHQQSSRWDGGDSHPRPGRPRASPVSFVRR